MAHPLMHVPTTSWGLLQHRGCCQARESCRAPDQACLLCSILLVCQILIYLHSSHLQTCHTCPHRWCLEDPCSHQIGSECQCLFLLVALLSIDLLWDRRAWTTEMGGISETGGQDLRAHPSPEAGGRCWLIVEPEGRWSRNMCKDFILYHQNYFLVSNEQDTLFRMWSVLLQVHQGRSSWL